MEGAVEKPDRANVDLVPAMRPITVQDLMRHTSGLTYGFLPGTPVAKMYQDPNLFGAEVTNADFAEAIAKLPLAAQPGSSCNYSHSTDVPGRVLEGVSGTSLYPFYRNTILSPLAISH